MTKREVISRIRNSYNEHYGDTRLTNRHIDNILTTSTLTLVKRLDKANSLRFLTKLYRTICIEMIPVSAIECSCIDLPIDCTIYRSKNKVQFNELSTGIVFKSITSPDRSIDFQITTATGFQRKNRLKKYPALQSKSKFIYYENEYLYTPDTTFPYLLAVGYFKAGQKSDCADTTGSTGSECMSELDQTFNVPDDLIDVVIKIALDEIRLFKGTQYDTLPNKDPKELTGSI